MRHHVAIFLYTHEAKIKELLSPTFEKDKLAICQFLICRLSIIHPPDTVYNFPKTRNLGEK